MADRPSTQWAPQAHTVDYDNNTPPQLSPQKFCSSGSAAAEQAEGSHRGDQLHWGSQHNPAYNTVSGYQQGWSWGHHYNNAALWSPQTLHNDHSQNQPYGVFQAFVDVFQASQDLPVNTSLRSYAAAVHVPQGLPQGYHIFFAAQKTSQNFQPGPFQEFNTNQACSLPRIVTTMP